MKKILLSSLLCASVALASSSDYKYEVTPMFGGVYTEGNMDLDRDYANAGLGLGFNLDDSIFDQIEVGFFRNLENIKYKKIKQNTGVTRVFANLVKDYPLSDSFSLYALIGIGVELFDVERYKNESSPFGNYGIGLKYKISNGMSLKTDLRHLIETDHGDNSLLYNIGLAIPFGKKAVNAPEPKKIIIKKEEEIVIVEKIEEVVKAKPLDDDKDGVLNSNDKCLATPFGNIVDQDGCTLNVNLSINFKVNSAVIDKTYSSKIQKFANFMNKYPSLKANIEAHTDSDASEKYNLNLSKKRAKATVQALEKLNVDKSRLKSIGYGESRPVASNATKEGKAQNRRVTASVKQ